MQKILFISSRADVGGGPEVIRNLIRVLDNYDLYLASPYDKFLCTNLVMDKLKKHLSIKHRTFSFVDLIRIYSFLRRNKIDIIHSHGRGAGVYSRLLKVFGYKVVHTFHGINSGQSDIKSKIKNFVERIFKPLTDKYICVSKAEVGQVRLILGDADKVILIPNFISKNLKSNFRGEVSIIGVLSRFDPVKGIKKLLTWIADSSYLKEFEFYIAGDGEERELYLEYIKKNDIKNVKMFGFIDNKEQFFNDIDLFVSCSLSEGLPLSVLESISYGVPCLLSNIDAHKEFLDYAFLYDLDSRQDFEENIKDTCRKFDISKRKSVIEKFSEDKFTLLHDDLYRTL